jgi:hypothetical protein
MDWVIKPWIEKCGRKIEKKANRELILIGLTDLFLLVKKRQLTLRLNYLF